MIEPDAIEAVLKRENALYLVRLDHGREHVRDSKRRPPFGSATATQPVRDGQDRTEVVGRMTPLGRKPGVVEIEPADDRADVEGRRHRIEFIVRTRNTRAAREPGTGHDRSEQLCACGVVQRQHATAQGVHEAVAGDAAGGLACRVKLEHVVGDLGQHGIGCGTDGFARCNAAHQAVTSECARPGAAVVLAIAEMSLGFTPVYLDQAQKSGAGE